MDPYDADQLLAADGRAALEVTLRKAAYALAGSYAASGTPAPRATGTTTSDSWHWPPR